MEKTVSITIASRAFILSESAFEKLQSYLDSLKNHFKGNEDHDEIMKDIESRIAELLEPQKGAIPPEVIDEVILNMGSIADFENEEEKVKEDADNDDTGIVGKKFYRNTDDMLIAGVCSGLGAYFGVDATWVRLAFVIMTFMSGFGILFYLILWIITPEAKSKAQKLEMAGSPVTLETLSETVREKAIEVRNTKGDSIRRILVIPFRIVGGVIQFFVKSIPTLLRIFLGIGLLFAGMGGLVLIMIMSGFLLSGDARIGQDVPLSAVLPGLLLYSTLAALTLTVLVPALFTFLGGFSLLRKKNMISSSIGFVFFGVWLLALLVSGFGVAKGVHNYGTFVEKSDNSKVVTRNIPLAGVFTKIDVRDGLNLEIVEGTSTALISRGRIADTEALLARIENDTLIIEKKEETTIQNRFCVFCFQHEQPQTIKLTLPMSQIVSLSARNNSSITSEDLYNAEKDLALNILHSSRISLRGEVKNLEINLDSNSSADLSFTTEIVTAKISNGSELELNGSGKTFDAFINNSSSLNADGFMSNSVKVEAINGSNGRVYASKLLNAKATHSSSISYSGGPTSVKDDADEGSSVEKG